MQHARADSPSHHFSMAPAAPAIIWALKLKLKPGLKLELELELCLKLGLGLELGQIPKYFNLKPFIFCSCEAPQGFARNVPQGFSRKVPQGLSRKVPQGFSRKVNLG